MFRSVDDGNGWEPANKGMPNRDKNTGFSSAVVFDVALGPHSQHLFAGTDHGVFWSRNYGESWRPLNRGLPGTDKKTKHSSTAVRSVVTLADDGKRVTDLLAATDLGAFRFTHRQKRWRALRRAVRRAVRKVFRFIHDQNGWQAVNEGLPPETRVSKLAVDRSTRNIYAATDHGLFRSTDYGEHWAAINSGLRDVDTDVHSVVGGVADELFAATPLKGVLENEWPDFGLGGDHIDLDSSHVKVPIGSWIVLMDKRKDHESRQALYQATAVSVVPRKAYGLSGKVTRVRLDHGEGLDSFDLRHTEVFVRNAPLDLPVERWEDPGPVKGAQIELDGIVQHLGPQQPMTLTGKRARASIGDTGGVLRLNGGSWRPLGPKATDVRALVVDAKGVLFAGTRAGGVYRSRDDGLTWTAVNSGLSTLDVRALAAAPTGALFAGTRSGGVFRSADSGDNWEPANTGLEPSDVRALAAGPGGAIYAGTRVGGVFRTTDGGRRWVPVNSGLASLDVRALAVGSKSEVFAGTVGGGVCHSTDNGASWSPLETGLANNDVLALAVDSGGRIFAGTQGGGVFAAAAAGEPWLAMRSGLSPRIVRSLAVGSEGEIYAAVPGAGVFRAPSIGAGWANTETGVSNDVRALVVDSTGQVFAGASNATMLAAPEGDRLIELRPNLLLSLEPGAETDLDRSVVTDDLLSRLKETGLEVSEDASVVVVDRGRYWLLDSTGDNVFAASRQDWQRVHAINASWPSADTRDGFYSIVMEGPRASVYQRPGSLLVLELPSSVEDQKMLRWYLQNEQGMGGYVTAGSDEITLNPAAKADEPVGEVTHHFNSSVSSDHQSTAVALTAPLEDVYDPSTVHICGNAVDATHGETTAIEVLGSGKADEANQSFSLMKSPLTYVASVSEGLVKSTLSIRVISGPPRGVLPGLPATHDEEDGVLWEEVSTLYNAGPLDQVYMTQPQQDGKTRLIFGDGKRGARLPTGTENVVATYRTGIGQEGDVDQNSLSLLRHRPFGVRGVTNPVPATGASGREPADSAINRAPKAIRALGRIVSLRDYEDFTANFAGVSKAHKALWTGKSTIVDIAVADAQGKPLERDSDLYRTLVRAIHINRAAPHQVLVDPFEPLFFNVEARVLVDRRHRRDAIEAAARSTLEETFSFDRRHFGQGVAGSEIIALLKAIPGVVTVELKALHISGFTQRLEPALQARTARWNRESDQARPAQLLLINSPAGLRISAEETS